MDGSKTMIIDRFVQAVSLHGLNLVNETKNAQGDGSTIDFLVPNPTNTEPANYFNHRLQKVCYDETLGNMESRLSGTRLEPVFGERIRKFIATKSDLLFQLKGREELRRGIDYGLDNNHEVLDLFSKVPPLEMFMGIPSHVKRSQLFKVMKEGDIALGEVISKRPFGIFVKLTALEFSKSRDFTDTNIEALCRSVDLYDKESSHREHKDPTDSFLIGDYVRGVIISVNLEEERVAISFKSSKLAEQHHHLHLGLLEDNDGSKESYHYSESKSYAEHLTNHVGLNNPRNIDTLIDILGVNTKMYCSLLRSFQRCGSPEEEYFNVLRKKQSVKWSMESTAKGIELFKAGDIKTAMKYLGHALQIDAENVEALVARGALSANEGKYSMAVNDFRQALSINRIHRNASKYLVQTLIEQGIQQEKNGKLTEALNSLEEALEWNPDQPTAKEHLHKVKQLIAIKRQKEEKDLHKNELQDLTSKFSHVRELIEEEQIRKKKKKKKDKRKRKKQKIDKKKKKTRRRSRERSSTDDSSSYQSETKSSRKNSKSIQSIQQTDDKPRGQDYKINNSEQQKDAHGSSQASLSKRSTEKATRKRRISRSSSCRSSPISDHKDSRSRKRLKVTLKSARVHQRKGLRSASRDSSYSQSSSSDETSADRSRKRRSHNHSSSRKPSRKDERSRSSSGGANHSRSSSSQSSDRITGRLKRSRIHSRSRKLSRRDERSRSSSNTGSHSSRSSSFSDSKSRSRRPSRGDKT